MDFEHLTLNEQTTIVPTFKCTCPRAVVWREISFAGLDPHLYESKRLGLVEIMLRVPDPSTSIS